ncbi:oxytocin-neurophysin 1-like [Thrips palmi]|uniref:Oxytocin-neurophysin 1-like n=1 Tax=Thrips palmi TaxID=161013 RepID=A0A6P9AF95_THRPL|nr:oxytocin-neurophysin 1-like [Thrips palmi]
MKTARGGAGGGLLLVAALLALLGACWACLITNCPRGGKRSGSAVAVPGAVSGRNREVQCAACGPGGEGLCIGPGICCSPLFGCVMASRGTCTRAVAFPPHCAPPPSASGASTASAASALAGLPLDAPCGADLTPDGSAPGRCAAQGVCCTHDSCRIDAVCQSLQSREDNEAGFDTDFLLTSLRRLG